MFCIFLWYCWWGCSFWACCGSGGSIMSTHPSPGATACPVSWSNCLSSRRGSYQLEEVELAAMWWNNTTYIRTYIGNNTKASFFKCFQLFKSHSSGFTATIKVSILAWWIISQAIWEDIFTLFWGQHWALVRDCAYLLHFKSCKIMLPL